MHAISMHKTRIYIKQVFVSYDMNLASVFLLKLLVLYSPFALNVNNTFLLLLFQSIRKLNITKCF